MNIESIPFALRNERRWIVARLERVNGRMTKVPYDASHPTRHASTTDPRSWRDFETARRAVEQDATLLLGFVLGGGFVGGDWDHCRNPETGVIEPWATTTITMLDSYTETSISGTGVHVICRGKLPAAERHRTGKAGKYPPVPAGSEVEMYDHGRYFVMTGHVIRDSSVEERTPALATLHRSLFGAPASSDVADFDPNDQRGKENITDADVLRPITCSDDELIARITNSGQGEKFSRLWAGDTSLHGGDHSVADLALCTILAFWTQRDAERIDRLFRQSKLCRTKWEHRADYRGWTISKAIAATAEAYQPPHVETVPESEIAYE